MSYICVTPLTMNLNNPELAVAQEPVLEAVRALHTGVTRKSQCIAAFFWHKPAPIPPSGQPWSQRLHPSLYSSPCSTPNLWRAVM